MKAGVPPLIGISIFFKADFTSISSSKFEASSSLATGLLKLIELSFACRFSLVDDSSSSSDASNAEIKQLRKFD